MGVTRGPAMPYEEAVELVRKVSWYHAFELLPGLSTPGQCPVDARVAFDVMGMPADLGGSRVLEIGSWDGPFAFELERRGADVTAVDIQDPDRTGFNTAARILGSRVRYVRASVYDLRERLDGLFDSVVYLGVYYHLKSPIAGFEQISQVLADNGTVYFEGEGLSHYAETLEGRPFRNRLLLAWLAHSGLPLTLCYPDRYKGQSNWFVPNTACLRSWLVAAGLQPVLVRHGHLPSLRGGWGALRTVIRHYRGGYQRIYGTAVKRGPAVLEEHPLV